MICHFCLAERSDGPRNFRDCSDTAAWKNTLGEGPEPWLPPHPWLQIPGFSTRWLAVDMLHSFHLGLGRVLCGSPTRMCCLGDLFGAGPRAVQVARARRSFRVFARAKAIRPALRSFASVLPRKASIWIELHCKGSDTALVCSWLAQFLIGADLQAPELRMLATCMWAWDEGLRCLTASPTFLTSAQALEVHNCFKLGLQSYSWLFRYAVANRARPFKIKPKFHLLCHVRDNLCSRNGDSVLNPMLAATWGDEDFVGKCSRLSRRCHPSSTALRCTQRYILGVALK